MNMTENQRGPLFCNLAGVNILPKKEKPIPLCDKNLSAKF